MRLSSLEKPLKHIYYIFNWIVFGMFLMICIKAKGFSLIDLMIALTIFSVGILAIARLQLLSFRNMEQGTLRTIAILEMSNLLVQYRLWQGEDTFQSAFDTWQEQVKQLLPNAQVQFTPQGPTCTLHLSWQPLAIPYNLVDTLDYVG